MKRLAALLVLSLTALPLFAEQKQVLSNVYPIVKKYKSMEGPAGTQIVYLGDRNKPELLWLTAIKTEVVGEDGKTRMSPELMCHMNIDIEPVRHKALFNLQRMPATRLMTISQGMRVPGGGFEARLPEGFAFPIASNEPLYVMTQVLNHNIEHPHNLKVRHRVTFEYVRDAEVKQRPIALFNLPVSGMVQMNMGTGMLQPLAIEDHGPSCLVGQRAPNAAGMMSDYVDPQGHHMVGHWVVPPGKQVNASDATWFMNLPYDSKLHYAAVHLHPFARSLTLRDTTTGTDIFKAAATNPKGRVGLDRVDAFVSIAGVPMYKDHKYEMISVYDNPTKQNVDSMASMFLALDDPEFVAPTPEQLADRGVIISPGTGLILRTSLGDFGAMMIPGPTSVQFAKSIASFRNAEAKIGESSIAFSAKVAFPVFDEPHRDHMPGAISICRGDGEATVVIETRKTSDFDRCTMFALIGPGADVIRAITAAGGATLLRAEVLTAPELTGLKLAPPKSIAAK
ncbi:MAG TPA: hypothetical protein VI391_03615 [Thermoanaerobaculia bacterium]